MCFFQKKANENLSNSFQAYNDKKKRQRRIATDIDRHYKCPLENCQKSYGYNKLNYFFYPNVKYKN